MATSSIIQRPYAARRLVLAGFGTTYLAFLAPGGRRPSRRLFSQASSSSWKTERTFFTSLLVSSENLNISSLMLASASAAAARSLPFRSEEHTSELQSP